MTFRNILLSCAGRTKRRKNGERASVMVEFALVAPLLITMAFGMLEIHGLLKASETASRVALQTADLVARETVTTSAEIDDIRELALHSLGLEPDESGRVTVQVASIGFHNDTGAPMLRWRSTDGSALPITLADATGLGGKGESVIQVLVVYQHQSALAFMFPQSMIYRDVAWARPRNTRLITLDGIT